MNSAKFITLCFGFLTVITMLVAPVLSALSGFICAGVGVCSYKKGISSTQYAISAIVLLLISSRLIWIMQWTS